MYVCVHVVPGKKNNTAAMTATFYKPTLCICARVLEPILYYMREIKTKINKTDRQHRSKNVQ